MSLSIQSHPAQSAPAPPRTPLYLTARYEQLSHIHPNVGATGTATANAFLYQHNDKKYVITSAHTLFSESMATTKSGATMPSEIRVGTTPNIAVIGYSRFFDVAILDGTNVNASSYTNIYNTKETDIIDCVAHFEDPNADDVTFTTTANARLNINRRTRAGAFFYKLMNGSSGSAISKNGELIGMVSGCDQQYDNLTVFVPATTIIHLLDRLPATNPNLDALKVFPKIMSAPLPKGLKAYFPEKYEGDTLLNHVILYADYDVTYKSNDGSKDLQLLPLTLVEPHLANHALEASQGTYGVKYCPIKEEYRKWFHFPREIVYREKTYTEDNGDVVSTELEYGFEVLRGDVADSLVWEGMNVMIGDSQINEKVWTSGAATIYPFSCMYFEYMNKNMTTEDGESLNLPLQLWSDAQNGNDREYAFENPSDLHEHDDAQYKIGTANGVLYKELTLKCLVRHWGFLVMSMILNIRDAGNQFIVFATECKRLKGIKNVKDYMDVTFLQMILNKVVEFVDLQALNFFFVFCKVFDIPKQTVEDMKRFFPINNMNKATTDIEKEWYEVINNEEVMKNTFDIDGNSSFNINGLEAEHYHMVRSGAQSLTAQRQEGSSDTIAMELELVYAEITRHQSISTWEEKDNEGNYTFLYYPQSFQIVKSMWDHSHTTMANLLPELSNAFEDA